MKASFIKHQLQFKKPGGTSRGILTEKSSWFIILREEDRFGIGECSVLKGLSPDDQPGLESQLKCVCEAINNQRSLPNLKTWPAIAMAVEMAYHSFSSPSPFSLFPSDFTKGTASIPINGLVWMGDYNFMKAQVKTLLNSGFDCIKIKIGAIDFDEELALLKQIRKEYSPATIEIRVDANGAFSPRDAIEKLERLSAFSLHSIEQPIGVRQWDAMAELCKKSPLPIALDEELISCDDDSKKESLLLSINPQYVILKPSLLGGLKAIKTWIDLAEKNKIGWWVTSALESNIGLNAIAQWTYSLGISQPQGLGTGSLFVNNIASPLCVKKGCLYLENSIPWQKFP